MSLSSPPITKENSLDEKKDERQIWEEMDPLAWHHAVCKEGSVFLDTYEITRQQIIETLEAGHHDVVIECGSGTGDIIGNLEVTVDRYGIDINDLFVEHSKEHHNHENMTFLVQDILHLEEWWTSNGFDKKYKAPLVICVNNTLNIMPEDIRGQTIDQMLRVSGDNGHCLITYWNGNFFSHAIMNFYLKNPQLCGPFTFDHVDWDNRILECPSGYSTHWMNPQEVQRLLRSYDVNIVEMNKTDRHYSMDNINSAGLAIFAWFSKECTSGGKSYYDSDDAQTFYGELWGESETHIGRYDLLTEKEITELPKIKQIARAEELHELEFMQLIQSKTQHDNTMGKMRILDMGCGYGGLLRRLWKDGLVWRATGCDYSHGMCKGARRVNDRVNANTDIKILEESYLDVSLPDESVDLVISMDALLHVGPDGQKIAIKEANRVLRPGGWMIFSDIMQQEVVDVDEMQPIYNRIHLSKMGTSSHYQECLEQNGFTQFTFSPHSSNVSTHYGTVREVLLEKKDQINVSPAFVSRMESGLKEWHELAPKNIVWGLMSAQKTINISE